MNPYRRLLARHYCPVCNVPVVRVRPSTVEGVLRELLAAPIVLFVGLLGAGVMERLGWLNAHASYVLAVLAAAMVAAPLLHRFAMYRCDVCLTCHKADAVVSRGWLGLPPR
ncbi:MAG: hypothetical protein MUC68_17510 [Burkholderiaceae bacterium]|jgi:hypothetical protein|nr:hypothetical protein [Burkholderiaceae bacterium]